MPVSIIGYGYVGSALGYLCKKNNIPFRTYDVIRKDEPAALMNTDNLEELVRDVENDLSNSTLANVYFICVPTPPSEETGECDTTIVEKVISDLSKLVTRRSYVVIKSTVRPGTTRRLQTTYGTNLLDVVFCPEFLRERTFQEDMYNASFTLLGMSEGNSSKASTEGTKQRMNEVNSSVIGDGNEVNDVFKKLYAHNPNFEVLERTYEECELFKYTINVFLSVKVWYFNEIESVCSKFGVDYKNFKTLFDLEPRIGESHTDVPGHDGKRGFGGKCLPKETKALCHLQKTLGLDNTVLKRILERNFEMRGSEF